MSNALVVNQTDRTAVPPTADSAPSEVSIVCHDGVPASLGAELDALYHHIHASLSHHVVAGRARHAHAYVARRGECALAIFLFQREGRSVVVFNEMMQLAQEEIERFARYVFSRFPGVARISFSKIGREVGRLALPWQQYGQSEDIVVSLPGTPEAYFSKLGAKMRHSIRHQTKAIGAAFPGLSIRVFENGTIAERHITSLVRLKKAAMDDKRIRFGITPEECAWMIEHARTHGLLVVALLGDDVCGGSLSFRLGDHYFAHVNGYDARFAKYSLGMLCCHVAMNESIARGATEAHLSRGRNPYKFKLLGVARDMANLDLYRSRAAYYGHAGRVLRNALRNAVERRKRMLLENEQRGGARPSLTGRLVKTLRNLKRSGFRPAR
jgi:hypothetical protein